MKHTKIALAGLLALSVASAAVAQTFPTVPDNTVIGRLGAGGSSGPSQAIPFATLAQRLGAALGLYGITSVESCGAVGNGTSDDSVAIRNCMAQIAALPLGGKLQFSCNKTYRLASYGYPNGTLLRPYSNLTLEGCGESSILKVGNALNNGVTSFHVIFPPDLTSTYTISNFHVRNLKIDENGANNTGFNYQNIAIGVLFGSNISVQNVTFTGNPGSQYVSIGQNAAVAVDTVSVTGNVFGDACDIINASCTDHTSAYVVANNFVIANNIFKYSSQSLKSSAWEMHGSNGVATGNSVNNYYQMTNIAAINHAAQNMVMSGNSGTSLVAGFRLYHDGTSTLSDILISDNSFRQSVQHATNPFFDFDQGVTSATNNPRNVTFSNNTFASDVGAGTANTTPTLVLGRMANQVISGNLFNGGLGPCVGAGTFGANTSFQIENNTMIDCGKTSTAAGRRGILINSGTTVRRAVWSGNRIENFVSTYMTTGIDVTLNATYGAYPPTNLINNVATPVAYVVTGFLGGTQFNGIMYGKGESLLPAAATAVANGVLVTDNASLPALTASLTNGQVVVGQTGAAPLPKTLSGACTLTAAGALSCSAYSNTFFATQSGPCGTVPQNATSFIGSLCWNATEANAQIVISKAVTFTNLQIKVTAAPAAGQTYAFTVRKNAGNTSITCTIANPNTTCADLVNNASFVAADLFDLQLVSSATAGAITAASASVTSTTVFP